MASKAIKTSFSTLVVKFSPEIGEAFWLETTKCDDLNVLKY